jgi:hypothetical protein
MDRRKLNSTYWQHFVMSAKEVSASLCQFPGGDRRSPIAVKVIRSKEPTYHEHNYEQNGNNQPVLRGRHLRVLPNFWTALFRRLLDCMESIEGLENQ